MSGVRTPVGRYMGALKSVAAYDLAAVVLQAAVEKAGIDPGMVDEVVLGQSYQSGEYVNIARMALLKAGWPDRLPGITLDRRCCTGLDVVRLAAAQIASGQVDIVAAGGVESMSTAPYVVRGARWGLKLRHDTFVDTLWEGLTDPVCGEIMGYTAENLAMMYNLSQAEQAIQAYQAAAARLASEEGYDGIICGHLHHPVVRQYGDVLYCNDGDWVEIPAHVDSAPQDAPFERSTKLMVGGASVTTVEHVLATLYGLSIDNCILELDGPEPPEPAVLRALAKLGFDVDEAGASASLAHAPILIGRDPARYGGYAYGNGRYTWQSGPEAGEDVVPPPREGVRLVRRGGALLVGHDGELEVDRGHSVERGRRLADAPLDLRPIVGASRQIELELEQFPEFGSAREKRFAAIAVLNRARSPWARLRRARGSRPDSAAARSSTGSASATRFSFSRLAPSPAKARWLTGLSRQAWR